MVYERYTCSGMLRSQRSLMDHVLIDSCSKERLLDVIVLRGAAGAMLDRFLVKARVKFSVGFRDIGVKEAMKVSKLGKQAGVQRC